MDPTIVSAVIAIVALALAGYALVKASQAGKSLTTEVISNVLNDSAVQATELTEVALTAAQAAEQLYRTGKIERNARMDHAFNYVRQWFPDLDQKTVLTAIEAGVLVVNSLVDALPKRGS